MYAAFLSYLLEYLIERTYEETYTITSMSNLIGKYRQLHLGMVVGSTTVDMVYPSLVPCASPESLLIVVFSAQPVLTDVLSNALTTLYSGEVWEILGMSSITVEGSCSIGVVW